MSSSIRKISGGSLAVFVMALSGLTHADPVERVVSFDVSNASAHMAALDEFFTSDLMRGQKATLWAPMFPGSSQANRTLVVSHDSFEDLAVNGRRISDSREWMELQRNADGSAEVLGNSMAQQMMVAGSGWTDHGALIAVTMTVTDLATYVPAFAEMIESVDNPGSIRLMQMRYGGGATNTVALFSAPDPAAANKYIDDLQDNEAFREFAAKVAGVRTVNNISLMRRVKAWGK